MVGMSYIHTDIFINDWLNFEHPLTFMHWCRRSGKTETAFRCLITYLLDSIESYNVCIMGITGKYAKQLYTQFNNTLDRYCPSVTDRAENGIFFRDKDTIYINKSTIKFLSAFTHKNIFNANIIIFDEYCHSSQSRVMQFLDNVYYNIKCERLKHVILSGTPQTKDACYYPINLNYQRSVITIDDIGNETLISNLRRDDVNYLTNFKLFNI